MNAKAVYTHVLTIIGSKQVQNYYQYPPTEEEAIASEVAGLLEQPQELRTIVASIDQCLSRCYRQDISLSHSLLQSGKTTLDDCYIEMTLIQRDEQAAHEKVFSQNQASPDYEQLYLQEVPIPVSQLWEKKFYAKAIQAREKKLVIERGDGNYQPKMPHSLKSPKRLVIRGAAGIGKTTLLRCLAAQWGKLYEAKTAPSLIELTHWRKKFCLLVHIPLRDLLTYESMKQTADKLSLDQKILMAWLKQTFSALNQKQFIVLMLCLTRSELVQSYLPGQVLLLLDGLDEVSNSLKQNGATRARNVQQDLLDLFLKQNHWLLTTRPHLAEHAKLATATHDLALVGFSRPKIKKYVEHFFKEFAPLNGSKEVSKRVSAWLKQTQMKVLARIPLQLDLLCSIALDDKTIYDNQQALSLTMLYHKMLVVWVKRFLSKPAYSEYLMPGETADDLTDEVALQRCQMFLIWLSEIAWAAMQVQYTHFTLAKLQEESPSLNAKFGMTAPALLAKQLRTTLDNFGLLIPLGLARNNVYDQPYAFLHFTYQEFLAARLLADRLLSEKKKNTRKELIDSVQAPFYYRLQLFLVGILSHRDRELCRSLLGAALANVPTKGKELAGWLSYYNPSLNFQYQEITKEQAAQRAQWVHVCQLLETALRELASPSQGKADFPKVNKLLLRVIKTMMQGTGMFFYRLDFLFPHLLDLPEVKKYLEAVLSAKPINFLRWVGWLDCPLPKFVESGVLSVFLSQDKKLLQQAVWAIGNLGEHAGESLQLKLLDLIQGPNTLTVVGGLDIGLERKHETADSMDDVLKIDIDDELVLRYTCAVAIGRLGQYVTKKFKARLAALTQSPEPTVREIVAETIGRLGKNAGGELQLKLPDFLTDPAEQVRESAAKAIGWLLDEGSGKVLQGKLIDLLNGEDLMKQEVAAKILEQLEARAMKEAKKALADYQKNRGLRNNSSSIHLQGQSPQMANSQILPSSSSSLSHSKVNFFVLPSPPHQGEVSTLFASKISGSFTG